MDKKHVPEAMNQEQVQNILKFIDSTQSEPVKRAIFSQLGRECFACGHHAEHLAPFKDNVQAFLDIINVEQKSKYWESLSLSEDQTELVLTGRKVEGCACAFADCSQPPLSLCHYCCKLFQEMYFKTLFNREVEVEITEAFLLGHERCSTLVRFR
ncbi:MAG TPA: hypothetical protein VHP83_17445 [Aggregatilineaceae bacterium]|nr:hypothetical protein [Aggregatilineaceae bacterium]